ncbi:MAG: hypothetical protein IPK87_00860 [Planctomycetes bacterium]|nr:hypothetical protein [Planctomycetota bacterium]
MRLAPLTSTTPHTSPYQQAPTTAGPQAACSSGSNGQVEFTEGDLRYQTKYEYDDYNRLEAVIDDRDGGGPDKLDYDNYDFYDYDLNGNVVGITAYLYDDAGSGGDKVLATSFTYDSLNRLVEDEAPYPSGSGYTREYRYDSRGNRVFTVDRKGVERVYGYDLLDRPIRAEISDVEYRDISPSTGYVTTSTRDIVSRTVYDKNSNVKESIGPTGSRSYVRYDLAHRWLQTQYPDGGTGTPLKSSAGSGHSLTTVSGTPYYTKSGAYDGNGNLLLSTDANGTEIAFTWDNNDNLLEETGSAAAGNAFGIIGEAGMEYEYDGMYRAGRGRTNDGSDDLTEVNSLFNTLSGIERQQQIVYDAHPGLSTPYTSTGTVQSWFDESGRRYQRQNPSGVTRTAWHFDRKHRPVETWRSVNTGGGWVTDSDPISEYDYLGGGLLHSRHLKRHPQDPNRPIISEFKRDDLLRVIQVRHTRDDSSASFGQRLLGRFDTAYDENSMMLYEARWYEEDDDGSSTTPDATDFYFYDSANQLEKATYGVTQDDSGGSAPLDLSSIHWPNVNTNDVTHSDRVIYSRRHTGTRERVNWYRGSADPTDPIPGQFDESSNPPTQKTDYDTSDDPGADPDNPASDGEGSRNNYTGIGNVGLTYDNNRNLQADGTREFRYNYRNQLRKVWRKSDRDQDGLISQYREDAFGRRVLTHSWWELARRVYFDTRFELDVNMDADGDSSPMDYINGGITSTASAPMSHPHQLAEWESRIHRTHATLESHYYDFLLYVPQDHGEDVYLGMLGVYGTTGDCELHIYSDRYELWDMTGPTLLDDHYATTGGWRNIGLRAGIDAGVWLDGEKILDYGPVAETGTIVKFGTLAPGDEQSGIELYENLNYIRSYNRSQADMSQPPGAETGGYPVGGPRVTHTEYDGPTMLDAKEVDDNGSGAAAVYLAWESEEDGTRIRHEHSGGEYTDLHLPNPRRHGALIIRDAADQWVNDEGTLTLDDEARPGVAVNMLVDAVGQPTACVQADPAQLTFCWGPGGDANIFVAPVYSQDGHTFAHGVGVDRAPDQTTHTDSGVYLVGTVGGNAEADAGGEGANNTDAGDCCFRSHDSSVASDTAQVCGNTGGVHNGNGGNVYEYPPDVMLSGGYTGPTIAEVFGDDTEIGIPMGEINGKPITWRPNRGNGGEAVIEGGNVRELEEVAKKTGLPTDKIDIARPAGCVVGGGDSEAGIIAGIVWEWIKVTGVEIAKDIAIDVAIMIVTAGLGGPIVAARHIVDAAETTGEAVEGAAILAENPSQVASDLKQFIQTPEGKAAVVKLLIVAAVVAATTRALSKFTSWNCFVEGTLVWVLRDGWTLEEALALLARGAPIWLVAELVRIEQIMVGDHVLSRHESSESAPVTFSRVGETYKRTASNLVQLTTTSSESRSTGTLVATEEHPFWVTSSGGHYFAPAEPKASGATHTRVYAATTTAPASLVRHGWAFAGDLQPGHVLATPDCTERVAVASSQQLFNGPTTVYNLAVEGTATYFVSPPDAPEQAIWVHNAKKYGPKGGEIPDAHKKIVEAREKARAERRNAQARAAQPTECRQNPQGSKKAKGAQDGPSGERPSARRWRKQKDAGTRERNIGIDEEHSKRPKSNPGGAVGG